MSATVHKPDREAHAPGAHLAAEADHLRRLIEGQPGCLMRIDLEGHLLAVNGAALSLLGVEEVGQALTRNLSERMAPDQRSRWREFAALIGAGQPASMECDLTNFAGTARTVLLQGVPLLDHLDAVRSVIVSARDTSATKRLEQVLEQELEQELVIEFDTPVDPQHRLDEIQQALDAARLEQARLERLVEEAEGRRISELAQLRQSLAEKHQLAILQADRETRQRIDAATKELEQAAADREQIQVAAARDERSRVEGAQIDVARLGEELRARHAADLLRMQDAQKAEHAADLQRLREALRTEHEGDAARSREALQAQHEIESMRMREALKAAHESEMLRLREALKTAHDGETDRLREALKAAHDAETLRLREELKGELQAETARLRQELDGRRGADSAQIEQGRSEYDAEIARLKTELKNERLTARTVAEKVTSTEVLQSTLDAARLECERLRSVVGQQEAERDRLMQLQAAALENVRGLLAEERELALLGKERDVRRRIDDAEAGLASALEERQRLRAVLQESENERERLMAQQAAQRTEAEHALAEVAFARDRVTKAYTDQQVELQAVVGNALGLEAITGAGRVAREVGRELQDAAQSIDRRMQQLLSRTALDSGERPEIEALRAEALAVASLARQILAPGEPAMPEGADAN